jgi:hypothetical protein
MTHKRLDKIYITTNNQDKMRTLTIVAIIMVSSILTSFAQDTTKTKQKPKSTYQIGVARVTVWENKKPDGTTWKNFVVEKSYKKGDQWFTTSSFDSKELLELKSAIDKAIAEEEVKTIPTEGKK